MSFMFLGTWKTTRKSAPLFVHAHYLLGIFLPPSPRGVKRNLLLQTSPVCSDKASKNNKDMQAKKGK